MYEFALFSAAVAILVAVFFGHQFLWKGSRSAITFTLFALFAAINHLNLYFWLNMDPGVELRSILRALDYVIGLPLMLLGLDMLHKSAMARTKMVSRWVRPATYALPVVFLPLFTVLYLLLDAETARMLAPIILWPVLGGLVLYYLYLFRDNPYVIAKPEYERGTTLVIAGYLTMIFVTGIFASLLRQVELGIASLVTSLLLFAAGGAVMGTVTFAGIYSKLKVGILVVDKQGHIETSRLTDFSELTESRDVGVRTARTILPYIDDGMERVFTDCVEVTIPYVRIDPLDSDRLYQVDILPHRLDTEGRPITVLVILNDVTGTVEESETEQLSQLLGRLTSERDLAQFYLDMLSHDMGNMLQGILLESETAEYNLENSDSLSESLEMIKAQVLRSVAFLHEVKSIAQPGDQDIKLEAISVHDMIAEAYERVRESQPGREVSFNLMTAGQIPNILAEDILVQCFTAIIKYSIHRMTVPRGTVDVMIKVSPQDNKIIRIEVSDGGPKIPDSAKTRMFDWQNRSASPGSGIELPLAGALVRRYGGTIHAEDRSPRSAEEGVKFVIELPAARR
ncbi:MAG: sensor histidine kinase [Candidatus Thorarchaeota archaeon SMTZ1-83]|nr:MAG: hypothetical protein AM324_10940 [Candidatus Thorarchaeota archaeon SMTZ1-83]